MRFELSNQLIRENSPYLLQHANNPVNWFPWGTEALEKARAENKPIFLSVGYAACHWCHVMAHESFENEQTAAFLNEHFVSIKVDREERPDLDSIYMQAVVAMIGSGGWPLSVFLTPDGSPFYGGTYFPPDRRYNMPSFIEVLQTISHLWIEDRARLISSGEQIRKQLIYASPFKLTNFQINDINLNQAVLKLAESYDWKNGGWGKAPKFPQPMAIEFLLRKATRGDSLARDIAMHCLEAMARGGMYDIIGGGFARYSTDDTWCIPHFEKMLYDNAQLALVYLHAWLMSGKIVFRQVCENTLDFVLRELCHPLGGFFSSLDADSEGLEGKYYIWSPEEIKNAISNAQENEIFTMAFGLTSKGNFEGNVVLQRKANDIEIAESLNLQKDHVIRTINIIINRLQEFRASRIRPNVDDKVIVAWNGLALIAFAEAARYLGKPTYLKAARKNAEFLLQYMQMNGRLLRSWRAGSANHNAFLEDYAALILGLLAIYQTDPDLKWYENAIRLSNDMLDHFSDPKGGFFDTRDDHETLLIRPKEIQDNATPSGNSLAVFALLQLSIFEGNQQLRGLAEKMLESMQEVSMRYPTAFAFWLQATDFALGPVFEVAIIGSWEIPATHEFIQVLWKSFRPRFVAAISQASNVLNSPGILQNRNMINDSPTAYLCQDYVCLKPTNSIEEFASQLDSSN